MAASLLDIQQVKRARSKNGEVNRIHSGRLKNKYRHYTIPESGAHLPSNGPRREGEKQVDHSNSYTHLHVFHLQTFSYLATYPSTELLSVSYLIKIVCHGFGRQWSVKRYVSIFQQPFSEAFLSFLFFFFLLPIFFHRPCAFLYHVLTRFVPCDLYDGKRLCARSTAQRG